MSIPDPMIEKLRDVINREAVRNAMVRQPGAFAQAQREYELAAIALDHAAILARLEALQMTESLYTKTSQIFGEYKAESDAEIVKLRQRCAAAEAVADALRQILSDRRCGEAAG